MEINLYDAKAKFSKIIQDLSSHMDPFDQMLASQALSSNMTLITHDKSLLKYNIPSILLF